MDMKIYWVFLKIFKFLFISLIDFYDIFVYCLLLR